MGSVSTSAWRLEERMKILRDAVLVAILMGAGSSWAQVKPPNAPALGSNTPPPEYRIGPGDVLQVVVFKEPDFSVPEVSVQPDGNVALQFVGEIKAAGLTPLELQTSLAKALKPYIIEADVSILVKK